MAEVSFQSQRVDSFRRLLHNISCRLTEDELRSLIFNSEIPEAFIGKIKDGHSLFRHLINADKISKENVGYLKKLLRTLKPRRSDLVSHVDEYEKRNPHVRIIDEDEFTNSIVSENLDRDRGDSAFAEPKISFNINNAYMKLDFNCYKFPSCTYCSILLMGLLLFGIVLTCCFWYANVPRVSKAIQADKELGDAGPYLIALLGVPLLIVASHYAWTKFRRRSYTRLHNPSLSTQQEAVCQHGDPGSRRLVSTSSGENIDPTDRQARKQIQEHGNGQPGIQKL